MIRSFDNRYAFTKRFNKLMQYIPKAYKVTDAVGAVAVTLNVTREEVESWQYGVIPEEAVIQYIAQTYNIPYSEFIDIPTLRKIHDNNIADQNHVISFPGCSFKVDEIIAVKNVTAADDESQHYEFFLRGGTSINVDLKNEKAALDVLDSIFKYCSTINNPSLFDDEK